MARLVFGLMQSLDGYVDHEAFEPDPVLFRHFIDHARHVKGGIYGRRTYEIMRYWETDDPEWTADFQEFADVWRRQKKWVVSRTLKSVGPNATLIASDVEATVRRLKSEIEGELEVSGPDFAGQMTRAGLVDEFRLYVQPIVLGKGQPFFTGAVPKLRLTGHEVIGAGVVRLVYVPD